MRRHAKASSAGSTSDRGSCHGSFLRGAFVTRDPSFASKGSGALAARALSASVLAALALLMALTAAPASAAPGPPSIEASWTTGATFTEAAVKAEINPEAAATTYRIEYGPDSSYGSSTPEIAVGSNEAVHTMTRTIEGLAPGSTYHWHVVATNANGTSEGPDRTFATYARATPNTNCPNQPFRVGYSAALPDCRAYEMVTPFDKNGGDIINLSSGLGTREAHDQGSLDGDKLTYSSYKAFGDQTSNRYSNQYIASRAANGWITHGINAPQGTTIEDPGFSLGDYFQAFTPDLSSAWLFDQGRTPLASDALPGSTNLYRRDDATGGFEALTKNQPFPVPPGTQFRPVISGYSRDLSHTVFSANRALTPDASAGGRQVYDYSEGELHLVNLLPGNLASTEAAVGTVGYGEREDRVSNFHHAVSEDGSRIFWTDSSDGRGTVYVRIDGERTAPVSAGVVEGDKARFWSASLDGAKALFTAPSAIFNSGEGPLYEFDVDTETPTLIASEGIGVLGASDDLSYLYFVAKDDLAPGATAGDRNLYLDHEGTISFIGALSKADTGELTWMNVGSPSPFYRPTRVTPDGRHLAFQSSASLTGYDNTDANSGIADAEVYVYEAGGELICASCNPSGARPQGKGTKQPYPAGGDPENAREFTENGVPLPAWSASWLPTWEFSLYASHALSEDGSRVFFNSYDALLPQDTNGKQDVYEWQAQGAGGCQEPGGCLGLISTGESGKYSEFVDASPDGRDVFLRTGSSIDPRDEGLIDIYDARTNGGYPVPTGLAACEGEACQGPLAAPNDPTPASSAYHGPGNVVQAKKKKKKHHSRKKHHGKKKRTHEAKRDRAQSGPREG